MVTSNLKEVSKLKTIFIKVIEDNLIVSSSDDSESGAYTKKALKK